MLIISSRTRRGLKFSALRAAAAIVEPMSRAGLAPEPMRAGILMYHRIAPEVAGKSPLTWNVTPDRFRRQLADLLRLGFRPWPLQDLLDALADRRPFPPRTFAVTFDDGYASIHDYAWPILRELQIPATVFLATQYLDQDWFPFDGF